MTFLQLDKWENENVLATRETIRCIYISFVTNALWINFKPLYVNLADALFCFLKKESSFEIIALYVTLVILVGNGKMENAY